MFNPAAHAGSSPVLSAPEIVRSLSTPPKTRGIVVESRADVEPAPDEAAVTAPPTRRSINLDIPFANGSARLTEAAHRQLLQLGAALADPGLRGSRFVIAGHTSSTGSAAFNQKLSEDRAQTVRDYLVRQFGIAPERLSASGYGASQPLSDLPGSADEQRRVEISAVAAPE